MCGIVGQINKHTPVDRKLFNAMRDSLKHRGPDGFGTELLNNDTVALGHRRLSIIDLSENGKQPMSNEDGSVWITYNGEVYNYREIRNELIEIGYNFRSTSDTEILIYGYQEWGFPLLLEKLNGMFSFAIWDQNIKKLFGARDRIGIKPFVYHYSPSAFYFGSELKAIIEHQDISRELDKEALVDFFLYSFIPEPKTIYTGIKKLPPGHYFELDFDSFQMEITQYWQLEFAHKKEKYSTVFSQAEALLKNSVKNHLTSDVPVGVFLSAGYDSSALLMYSRSEGQDISSYSIGFENSERTEHREAAQIAEALGSKHHEKVLGAKTNFIEVLEHLYNFYDEPFAYSSMLSYYDICQFSSKFTKVALIGDGGDEVFAGYSWYNDLSFKTSFSDRLFSKDLTKAEFIKKYDEIMPSGIRHMSLNCFNAELQELIRNRRYIDYNRYYRASMQTDMKKCQYLDMHHFMAANLTRADITSMAFSMELRVPFLDHELVEYMFNQRPSLYFDSSQKKKVLYDQLQKHLPSEILNLPKRGFSYQFLKREMENIEIDTFIMSCKLEDYGIIYSMEDLKELHYLSKFQILNLAMFLKKWIQNEA